MVGKLYIYRVLLHDDFDLMKVKYSLSLDAALISFCLSTAWMEFNNKACVIRLRKINS